MLCRCEIFSQNSIWSIDVAFWDSRSVRMWYGLTGCGTAGRSRGNKKSAPGGGALCKGIVRRRQYILSYIDCDLSYFRSESDAALTPMLKLHERW